MKNNKGFAISTLLYGMLAVIIIVMATLVSSLRTKRNVNKSIADHVLFTLNKCSTKRAKLEQCLMDKRPSDLAKALCSVEFSQYKACAKFDVEDDGSGYSTERLKSDLIKAKRVRKVDNSVMFEKPLFVFPGRNPNNYFQYEGKLGRIIYINGDNVIKGLFVDPSITFKMDWGRAITDDDKTSYANLWQDSKINNHLRVNLPPSFNNVDKFKSNHIIAIGGVYPNINKLFPDLKTEHLEQDNIYSAIHGYRGKADKNKVSQTYSGKFTLPTLIDTFMTVDKSCNLINNNLLDCLDSSWIYNLEESWTSSSVIIGTGIQTNAYTNKHQSKNKTNKLKVYPTVYFTNITKVYDGDGTMGNPYKLG